MCRFCEEGRDPMFDVCRAPSSEWAPSRAASVELGGTFRGRTRAARGAFELPGSAIGCWDCKKALPPSVCGFKADLLSSLRMFQEVLKVSPNIRRHAGMHRLLGVIQDATETAS